MAGTALTQPGVPVFARAKFTAPRVRTDSVYRGELVDRLSRTSARLAVVSGPAGSGKSTLLSQSHEAEAAPVWVSLDESDNDPVVLWWSIIHGVRTVLDGFAEDYMGRLFGGGPAVIDQVVTAVADELLANGEPVRLFLDDLHLVDNETSRRSLHTLVRRLPAGARVIMASRHQHPVPLARLRAERDLVEVGRAELAMSSAAAQQLLKSLGVDLDSETVDSLVARTEGWPAGLQLVGMALTQTGDVSDFAASLQGTDRVISEYVFAEILDNMVADDRRFMFETAVLDRLSGELCDAVTGRAGSSERLRELEQANALVIPLDREGRWYRYHHLLGELLLEELGRRAPTAIPGLHDRAFEWHRDAGNVDEAIPHGLSAARHTEAADLLCGSWYALFDTGRLETAKSLVERFQPAEIARYQPLAIAAAFVYGLAGDVSRARHYIDAADRTSYDGDPPDGAATMESSLALMRGSLALEGVDQGLADGELAWALEPPESRWRTLAALIVGLGRVMKGDIDGSTPYFEEASCSSDATVRAYGLSELAIGHLARDDVAEAVVLAEEALQLVEQAGLGDLVIAGSVCASAALASLAAGDEARARARLRAAARPMAFVDDALPMDALRAHLLLAEAALGLEEHDAAADHVRQAARLTARVADTGAMDARLAEMRATLDRAGSDGGSPDPRARTFTDRELQVLGLLPLGLTTREMGEELYLSRNTIKTYLRRVYRKLGVSTRDDAVAAAHQLDLIDSSPS